MFVNERIRLSISDWLAYRNDIDLCGNGYINVARGGTVGRRIAPQDMQIRMAPRPNETGLNPE